MAADRLHSYEGIPVRPTKAFLCPRPTSAGEYLYEADRRFFEAAQIPPQYWRAPLHKIVSKESLRTLKRYEDDLWNYLARGMGGYFFGPANSGKSVAAGRIAEVAMRKGFSCLMLTSREIIDHLINVNGAGDLDEQITSRNLIILDNFRFSNPKTDAPVCDWVQMRASYNQPTIITSRVSAREHINGKTDLVPLLEHTLFPLYFPKSK